MTRQRTAFALLALALGCTSAASQGKVTIATDRSKELKRSAHRLRISVERLRNARAALREATDLARRLDPPPILSFASLASLWTQLDHKSGPVVFDQFFRDLRSAASSADGDREYEWATTAAQNMLSGIAEHDYDRAEALARTWPEPPPGSEEQTARLRTSMLGGLRDQALNRFAHSDPQRALAIVDAGGVQFGNRAAIVRGLWARGQSDDVARVIDRAKSDFAGKKPTAAMLHDFSSFVGQIAEADQQKALDAFQDLARAAQDAPSGLQGTTVRVGERSAELSPAEALLLTTIRSFSTRPDIIRQALDIAPHLRNKIEAVGGIDGALHPPVQGRRGEFLRRGYVGGVSPVGQIAMELRGKTASDPAAVRTKLSAIAGNAEGIRLLLGLANETVHRDPDLASLALETAAARVSSVEPKITRSGLLQDAVRTSRQVEGEVDPNLFREGFVLLDDLRQELKERQAVNPDGSPRGGMVAGNPMMWGSSPADDLESTLVSEYARDDFDGAMRYVRAMPDGRQKLGTLLRICESLRNNY